MKKKGTIRKISITLIFSFTLIYFTYLSFQVYTNKLVKESKENFVLFTQTEMRKNQQKARLFLNSSVIPDNFDRESLKELISLKIDNKNMNNICYFQDLSPELNRWTDMFKNSNKDINTIKQIFFAIKNNRIPGIIKNSQFKNIEKTFIFNGVLRRLNIHSSICEILIDSTSNWLMQYANIFRIENNIIIADFATGYINIKPDLYRTLNDLEILVTFMIEPVFNGFSEKRIINENDIIEIATKLIPESQKVYLYRIKKSIKNREVDKTISLIDDFTDICTKTPYSSLMISSEIMKYYFENSSFIKSTVFAEKIRKNIQNMLSLGYIDRLDKKNLLIDSDIIRLISYHKEKRFFDVKKTISLFCNDLKRFSFHSDRYKEIAVYLANEGLYRYSYQICAALIKDKQDFSAMDNIMDYLYNISEKDALQKIIENCRIDFNHYSTPEMYQTLLYLDSSQNKKAYFCLKSLIEKENNSQRLYKIYSKLKHKDIIKEQEFTDFVSRMTRFMVQR